MTSFRDARHTLMIFLFIITQDQQEIEPAIPDEGSDEPVEEDNPTLRMLPSSLVAGQSDGGEEGLQIDMQGVAETIRAVKDHQRIKGTRLAGNGRWYSQINHKCSLIGLGSYESQREAAVAFDQACLMLRGRDTDTLNYTLEDYLDDQGNVVEDPSIRELLTNKETLT